MSYVILFPYSNTNDTDAHVVVWAEDWARFINGAADTLPIAGSHDDYDSAEKQRDELNRSLKA